MTQAETIARQQTEGHSHREILDLRQTVAGNTDLIRKLTEKIHGHDRNIQAIERDSKHQEELISSQRLTITTLTDKVEQFNKVNQTVQKAFQLQTGQLRVVQKKLYKQSKRMKVLRQEGVVLKSNISTFGHNLEEVTSQVSKGN